MRAKALLLLLAVLLLGVTPTADAQSASPGVGYANLVPVGGSGLQGQLRFTDTGTALRTYSSAPISGFNPAKVYVTLLYGLDSRGPGEPSPICGRDTNLGFDEMFVGPWSPLTGFGTRSLDVNKLHSAIVMILGTPLTVPVAGGVRLDEVRTVSIREFNPPPNTSTPSDPVALSSFMLSFLTSDLPPTIFQLRACGRILPGNPPL
jgi:hypothetical protein